MANSGLMCWVGWFNTNPTARLYQVRQIGQAVKTITFLIDYIDVKFYVELDIECVLVNDLLSFSDQDDLYKVIKQKINFEEYKDESF